MSNQYDMDDADAVAKMTDIERREYNRMKGEIARCENVIYFYRKRMKDMRARVRRRKS